MMKPQLSIAMALALAVTAAERPRHARPEKPETNHAPVDPALPRYHPVGRLSGHLRAVQSDTTPGITDRWLSGFAQLYPDVKIDVPIGGSGGAGPELTAGEVDFGFIAREMMIKEEKPFIAKFGYRPLEIAVAGGSYRTLAFTDAITFFVNKDNPLEKLTFAQIDAMYSKTRKRGLPEITTWGQLGLTGEWADKPIHLFGVKVENGFEHFLQIHILKGGEWKDGITAGDTVFPEIPGVAADRYGIGYAGIAYLKGGVKPVALAEKDGGPYYQGTFQEVAEQTYPLSRRIFIYVNRRPGQPIDPVVREFVRYALSQEGQQAVVDDGIFLPLPARLAQPELAKLK